MINTSNLCMFEGRVAKDPQFSQVNGQNGPIEKVVFTLAVDRGMSSAQKQNAQNSQQATADFINCEMIGNQVNAFRQYCPKGKAIKIVCRYEQYQYQNQQTGQTQYGHRFNVDNFGFVVQDAKNMTQNGGGGNTGGFQQNNGYQQNNYQQNAGGFQGGYQQNAGQQQQNFMNAPQPQNTGNFEMFEQSNSASPF